MPGHRFPAPWSSEEHAAHFVVRDNNGQAIAYVYYENKAGRRSAAKLPTKDEARRIAVNIAKLPHFVGDACLLVDESCICNEFVPHCPNARGQKWLPNR
jgi:hypothetical protein